VILSIECISYTCSAAPVCFTEMLFLYNRMPSATESSVPMIALQPEHPIFLALCNVDLTEVEIGLCSSYISRQISHES
jgi:hypothetical protein